MPVIRVSWWSGHTKEERAKVAREITEVFTRLDIPPQGIHVLFEELPKENWATAGELHSERHA